MQKNCLKYPVEFVEDAFGESDAVAKMLGAEDEGRRVLIVADHNVVQRTEGLGTKIGRYVQERGIALAASPVVIGGGEKIKVDGFQSALRVVTAIADANIGRADAVLAIGGGAMLDVAGWAAAQSGGVPIVRVPTTPEAMRSAAFADYAALDAPAVKDAMRVPSVPAGVVVDTSFASTVLDGVWRGGIGEAVCLGLARDASFFKKVLSLASGYRNREQEALDALVRGAFAVRTKKGATTLALWSALKLQAMSGWKLPHGYAVSIGVLVDLAYAVEAGTVPSDVLEAVLSLFGTCGTLDGLMHSQYLLRQAETLATGLDDWRRMSPDGSVELLAAVGKTKSTEGPEPGFLAQALKSLSSLTVPL